jgi:hypothetical protein
VAPPVWQLYRAALARFGQVPTLVEWDTDVPPLDVLLAEAATARAVAAGFDDPQAVTAWPQVPAPPNPGVARPVGGAGPTEEMALGDIQQAFGDALAGPHRADAAAASVKGERTPARLAVYRGNLMAGWNRALSSAYPVIRQLVGAQFFGALARDYGQAHPSQSADLNQFGDRFAQFLAGFEQVSAYPYLSSMAELEWAVHLAHYAVDGAPLDPARFARMSAEQLERCRFALHPACRMHASAWATGQLWLAHQPDGPELPQALRSDSFALVVRPRWQVRVVPLGRGAHAAVSVLAEGESFGAALDAACALDQEFDVAANLNQWLKLGVFAAIAGSG